MSLVLDLNLLCLVCLRKPKKFHSIYDTDEQTPDVQILEKIMKCSELKVDIENSKLPDKICDNCLNDLMAAWRFRKNCKKANNMFQYAQDGESEILATIQLEQDEIKMPLGLKITKMNIGKTEVASTTTARKITSSKLTNYLPSDNQQRCTDLFIGDDRDAQSRESMYLNMERCNDDFEEMAAEPTDDDGEHEDHDDIYLTDQMTEEDEEAEEEQEQKMAMSEMNNMSESDGHNMQQQVTEQPSKRGRGRPKKYAQAAGSVSVEENESVERKTDKSNRQAGLGLKNGVKKSQQSRYNRRSATVPDSRSSKICEICGNSYKYQHALNAHMRRHNNVRPYSCEFCEKSFVACVELQRHMRVHTGQKPYPCQFCERRFSDYGSRIKHERTHTGERPYRCPTCNKSFAYAHVLSVHVRTHTGEKRFQCTECGKGFTKKSYLLAHQSQNSRSACVPNSQQIIFENTETESNNNIKSIQSDGAVLILGDEEYVIDDADIKYEDEDENLSMEEPDEEANGAGQGNKFVAEEVYEDNMAEEHLEEDEVDIVYEIQTN